MLRAAIVGGSGYVGGELLRLLLAHPEVDVRQISSERLAGKAVTRAHPNLRGRTELRFSPLAHVEPCDLLLLCLPHGEAVASWDRFSTLAERIVDLSADFRISDPELRALYYPGLTVPADAGFIYGIPELHRDAIRKARRVSGAGCNATAAILALYPLARAGLIEADPVVVDVKAGSSEGGNQSSDASHHPVRSGSLRSFKPTGHRHSAELIQALSLLEPMQIAMSATSVENVRGVLATCHVYLKEDLSERDLWGIYREAYAHEPFLRIVKERDGLYRYPEPKLLSGTNYCDVGFERDPHGRRLVVMSALDNLMKGAAGQAVQCLNLMCGFDETTALDFPGLHPI